MQLVSYFRRLESSAFPFTEGQVPPEDHLARRQSCGREGSKASPNDSVEHVRTGDVHRTDIATAGLSSIPTSLCAKSKWVRTAPGAEVTAREALAEAIRPYQKL